MPRSTEDPRSLNERAQASINEHYLPRSTEDRSHQERVQASINEQRRRHALYERYHTYTESENRILSTEDYVARKYPRWLLPSNVVTIDERVKWWESRDSTIDAHLREYKANLNQCARRTVNIEKTCKHLEITVGQGSSKRKSPPPPSGSETAPGSFSKSHPKKIRRVSKPPNLVWPKLWILMVPDLVPRNQDILQLPRDPPEVKDSMNFSRKREALRLQIGTMLRAVRTKLMLQLERGAWQGAIPVWHIQVMLSERWERNRVRDYFRPAWGLIGWVRQPMNLGDGPDRPPRVRKLRDLPAELRVAEPNTGPLTEKSDFAFSAAAAAPQKQHKPWKLIKH